MWDVDPKWSELVRAKVCREKSELYISLSGMDILAEKAAPLRTFWALLSIKFFFQGERIYWLLS